MSIFEASYNFKQLILCCLVTLLDAELIRYLLFIISERRAEKMYRQAVEQGRVIELHSIEELEALIEKLEKETREDEEE